MRALISLACIVAAALLTGALLSWPAFALVSGFSDVPFHKVLGRITSLGGLCWALAFLRLTGPVNAQRAGFGTGFRSSWKPAFWYCVAGLGIVLILEVLLLAVGVRRISADQDLALSVLLPMFISALCVGLAVSFVEELMYRGALYGALLRLGSAPTAMLLTSLLYAAAHHVKIRELAPGIEPDWLTGVMQLSGAMWRFSTPQIVDGYVPLFLVGLLLALLRRHYGQLGPCIGLHVGLVVGIKLASQLTVFMPKTRFNFLVNYYDHTLGWLAAALLLIAIAAFQFGIVRRSRIPGAMNRLPALLALLLLAACRTEVPDYFPLGNELAWEYQITRTIKGETKHQKLIIANLPGATLDGRKIYPRRRLDDHIELYEKTAEGVLRIYPDAAKRLTVMPATPSAGAEWPGETQVMFLEVTGAFSPTFEDRVRQAIPLTYMVESTDETVDVAAGRFHGCLRVRSNGSLFAGSTLREYMGIRFVQVEQTDWYAPGVGLIKRVRHESTTPADWNNEYIEELAALL